MTDAPGRIYTDGDPLTICGPYDIEEYDGSMEYVRADIHAAALERIAALEGALTIIITPDGDSNYDPYSRIYFATCTCDGLTVAWGFETEAFRRQAAVHQCQLRRERIGCELTDQEYGAGVLK
jgi:hypothetical protein